MRISNKIILLLSLYSLIVLGGCSYNDVARPYQEDDLWLGYLAEQPQNVTTPQEVANAELKAWKGEKVYLSIVEDQELKADGYRITPTSEQILIESPTESGLMYGVYNLMLSQAAGEPIKSKVVSNPAFELRMLNHWDNLDGTIERGYAGHSLWRWAELPDSVSDRYARYARANASVGINAVVLNNVNASPQILTSEYLQKVKTIADQLRPYGIKTYLSVNFASPKALGQVDDADPLNPKVIKWWNQKAKEIYELIPDFGGFLVKANSEGQPGPCDYERSHAQGANMLARALKPYGGNVIWRAFVYSPTDADRAKQAYLEFNPLDGQFEDNVIIQIKNGPIDFQPREPYSSLFDGLQKTDKMVEFQVTQEYLGHSNHLAYLVPMWKEFFQYVEPSSLAGAAGVSNVGDSPNYTANPLAQANWYGYGRLVWNPQVSIQDITRQWLRLSVLKNNDVSDRGQQQLVDMMTASREAVVNYMMPMGLHHIFAFGHHYGPEPWCDVPGAREDWLPRYYHRADSVGLGFDRTPEGSDAVSQYREPYDSLFASMESCPEEFLLWFHHVPWTQELPSGNTLWDELCLKYQQGVDQARQIQQLWLDNVDIIHPEVFDAVTPRLRTQVQDAQWWKDACLLYFQQFSGQPFPEGVETPTHDLDQLMNVSLGITNFECPSPELLDSVR